MNIEIANRLAELRKKHGLNQEELAEKLGVSRQAVSKWECGESSPDTDNLIALAKVYNMSLDELLGNPAKQEEAIEPEIVEPGNEIREDDDDDDDEPAGLEVRLSRRHKIRVALGVVNGAGFFASLIAYLLVGFLWKDPSGGSVGWAAGWTLLLVPAIISSILICVDKRRWAPFAYPLLVVVVYCAMGIIGTAYGVNLWHPYWFLFLTIPIYYICAGSIDRAIRHR